MPISYRIFVQFIWVLWCILKLIISFDGPDFQFHFDIFFFYCHPFLLSSFINKQVWKKKIRCLIDRKINFQLHVNLQNEYFVFIYCTLKLRSILKVKMAVTGNIIDIDTELLVFLLLTLMNFSWTNFEFGISVS